MCLPLFGSSKEKSVDDRRLEYLIGIAASQHLGVVRSQSTPIRRTYNQAVKTIVALDPYPFLAMVFVGGALVIAATMLYQWLRRVNAAVQEVESRGATEAQSEGTKNLE